MLENLILTNSFIYMVGEPYLKKGSSYVTSCVLYVEEISFSPLKLEKLICNKPTRLCSLVSLICFIYPNHYPLPENNYKNMRYLMITFQHIQNVFGKKDELNRIFKDYNTNTHKIIFIFCGFSS